MIGLSSTKYEYHILSKISNTAVRWPTRSEHVGVVGAVARDGTPNILTNLVRILVDDETRVGTFRGTFPR